MKIIFVIFIFISIFVLSISAQTNEARKIDSIDRFFCDELKDRINSFEIGINKEKNARGYIIVYEGKSGSVLPRIGEANSRIDFMKKLLKILRYSPKNIVFINGGYRENLTAEFWLVPQNTEPPKPTLTLKKIKHRKGKVPKVSLISDC